MPRPPKIRTPLRQVRDALSSIEGRVVSQAIFAKRLAISASYVNAIEAGTKPVTSDIATRVFDLYGVFPLSLQGRSKVAFHTLSQPLEQGIREWLSRSTPGRQNERSMEIFNERTARSLRALMTAAIRRGKGTFLLVRMENAIQEWKEELRLQAEYKEAWFASGPSSGSAHLEDLFLKHGEEGMSALLIKATKKLRELPKKDSQTVR